MARVYARDFDGGLTSLNKAETNYRKAEKLDLTHEFSMIQSLEQGKTKALTGVALFRLGRKTEAISTVQSAKLTEAYRRDVRSEIAAPSQGTVPAM
jgi:hypothetical protein